MNTENYLKYAGWKQFNGCVVCPICYEWMAGSEYITTLLSIIEAHKCERRPMCTPRNYPPFVVEKKVTP